MKLTRLGILLLLFLSGCRDLFYDPIETNDISPARQYEWEGKAIILPKEVDCLFELPDLSSTMSVMDLLDIALVYNPSTEMSWQTARADAFAYRETFSNYYPTIIDQETLTYTRGSAGSSTTSNPSAPSGFIGRGKESKTLFSDLTASYLLLDFGGRCAEVRLAKETLIAADWQHNRNIQQVLINVLIAYTSYIGNKGLRVADEKDLEDAKVALLAAEKMHTAGLATLTDVYQAKATVAQRTLALEQAKGQEKTSLGQLLAALGLPANTKICVGDLPDKLPVVDICQDMDYLVELAKVTRPDIGAAIAAVKEQEANLAISFSQSMPNLTANGSMSRLRNLSHPSFDTFQYNAFLQLTTPIFNGFFYVNQHRQFKAAIKAALASLEVQLSQVALDVVTSYYAFTTAVAALPSSEEFFIYSERAFKGQLLQYKTGTSSILDVLTALTALSDARAQVVVTRTQWASSLANLAFAVGILDDKSADWQDAPTQVQKKIIDIDTKDRCDCDCKNLSDI